MKKITVVALGLLMASPAFAATQVQQLETGNVVGDSMPGSQTDASNSGVSAIGIGNSSGIINQNVNSGAASNVGSATDIAISGGVRSGSTSIGGSEDGHSDGQLAVAQLQQVNVGNVVGDSAICSRTSAQTNGVYNVGVNGSQGVITQQVNAGITSNVGSAVGISIK